MQLPDIEIMIDSGSRPELLKQSVPTIKNHLKYSGCIKWTLHEVFLYPDKSNQCIHWAKYSRIFNNIVKSEPHGQGVSIGNCLIPCQAKYFIHWEDDHIATRDINLDVCVKILEENKDVNQIAFNKRATMGNIKTWHKKEVIRSNQILTTSPHWRYTPAIWRVDFIQEKWKKWVKSFRNSDNSHWQVNRLLKKVPRNADWVIKNLGTYYFGGIGNERYCASIGAGFSNRNKGYRYE